MKLIKFSVENLTDEEVLKEFVKRFGCDAAILVYKDSENEFVFGRWKNTEGRRWVNNMFQHLQTTFNKTF